MRSSRSRRTRFHRAGTSPHGIRIRLLACVLAPALLIAAGGCSRRPPAASWPEPRPLAARYASPANPTAAPTAQTDSVRTFSAAGEAAPEVAAPPLPGETGVDPRGKLTLSDALALALGRSPALAACAHEVAASDARAVQEGLWRNPEIDARRDRLWATTEEIDPDTGEPEDADLARTRVVLSQVIEPGREPSRRRAVAYAESELAAWDCESLRLQVAAEAIRAFAAALGAQEKLRWLREAREFVLETQRGVMERVASGEMAPRRLHQAERHAAAAEVELQQGESELAAARHRLAATWGACADPGGTLLGALEPLSALPDTALLRAAVERSPAVARWQSQIGLARAQARLAGAEAWPELRLDAGIRDEDETGARSYLLGVEVPLPLFDRAQGDRRAARHGLAAADAGQAAARAEAMAEAMTLYQELVAAEFAARQLRERVVPAAAAELAALQQGYAENAVGVGDLLDGARDLTRAHLDHIDALVACRQALADLEGLTGQPLGSQTP